MALVALGQLVSTVMYSTPYYSASEPALVSVRPLSREEKETKKA